MGLEVTDRVDTATAKGWAHPLRGQLIAALRRSAPGTATSLAAELGVSTGATSYHLRQLARHGLLTEVAAAGRERWWRLTVPDVGGDGAAEAWLRLRPEQALRLAEEVTELVDRYRLLSRSEDGEPVLVRFSVGPAAVPLAGG